MRNEFSFLVYLNARVQYQLSWCAFVNVLITARNELRLRVLVNVLVTARNELRLRVFVRPKIHGYTGCKRTGFVKPDSVKLAKGHLLHDEAGP